ncbi:hypothetical protein [Paraburkholderia domus]|uniref:hypothetical protein n=1 Tax=Paraburkholderia domus TaxID=2793075 RepID=UPI001911B392|nr:hypothetical protein [Paraburkholderia domus]MBK5185947.1 hypothetical protein [Burkholderia sp. R-69749]CAE6887806.1 hypothetical protein R69749_07427 [Paraburkholderia domus]
MSLTLNDHLSMMNGMTDAGFICTGAPVAATNPLRLEWHHANGKVGRYRLWAFDITHGGGGAEVRAADEFRIQITNGPATMNAFDSGGAIDLLVGYSRDRDSIVAYDRRWLENWTRKKEKTGVNGSPSIQVKESDVQAGHDHGIHHLTKNAAFGQADIVTLSPAMLPVYLLNHHTVLQGTMTAEEAREAVPQNLGTSVIEYCRAQGFPFEPDLIARYVAAALTKPLVILAGVSGTGKSKLAELVAEFYSADLGQGQATATRSAPTPGDSFVFAPARGAPDRDRFAMVAVRPDWIDNQSVLGFVNPITNKYESTQALDLILRAQGALDAAPESAAAPRFFMLLDEMNLARVEHYFSDWLACTESRRYRADRSIIQQPVPLHRMGAHLRTLLHESDGSTLEVEIPPVLPLPTNLIVTGTVNVDETTYGFSPKVLDRAMVLEFDEVDLERLRNGGSTILANGYRLPDTLPPFRLPTSDDYARLPEAAHVHIVTINGILEKARLHLGYRAANEIGLFMAFYNDMLPLDADDRDWLRALDAAILQKVLPRLSGNRAKLEAPLAQTCMYLRDLAVTPGDATLADFDVTSPARLPKSYVRALDMLVSLREFGFTSFFK